MSVVEHLIVAVVVIGAEEVVVAKIEYLMVGKMVDCFEAGHSTHPSMPDL